ncbi:hypothetical protein CK203_063409 [Vitis vinifera]|uniref:Integrase catalytic domain-containing protein n=1 Tax=Vitis vinifera TaxID=29760 RepID=A0A438G920_VITVI|nr:hypothetical protein CK203_063409 [Vitis vinifera]
MLVEVAPWYAHIANYLVTGEVPKEQQGIHSHCHDNACGGHFASQKTAMRVLQSGFCWPLLFKMPTPCARDVIDAEAWEVDTQSPCKHNDHRVVLKFLKENIFSRFGVPKAIISNGGTHFCNKPFETLLAKYGMKHKVDTPYHPQTSRQVELANREIKNLLMKVVNTNRKDCLWQSMSSPCGIRIQSLVGNQKLNMDLSRAGLKRFLDLNEMEELRNDAYINSKIAKEKLKRWIGPFTIHQVHLNGIVELLNSNSTGSFKVNGHRLKPFVEPFSRDKEEFILLDPHQA